jgi:hypothetical protein
VKVTLTVGGIDLNVDVEGGPTRMNPEGARSLTFRRQDAANLRKLPALSGSCNRLPAPCGRVPDQASADSLIGLRRFWLGATFRRNAGRSMLEISIDAILSGCAGAILAGCAAFSEWSMEIDAWFGLIDSLSP